MDRVVSVSTFGCKVNSYDSGLIQGRLRDSGFLLSDSENATVHVLNTCAVTAEATQQALRQARKLKRDDPSAKIVITGCAAQVDTEKFQDQECIDLVVANSHKGELSARIEDLLSGQLSAKVFKSNIFKKEDLEGGGGEELHHTRSFLKIQDGCNSFCTFCVIPFARGKSRSLEPADLIQRIGELNKQGVNEVVLTGVHIGDYESTSGFKLSDLVEEVLEKTKIARVRLSSLEPIELDDKLIRAFQNPRLCRHLHMSIQSGSTPVLNRMKRKYSSEVVREALHRIASEVPGAFVGIDVIAGFSDESDQEFAETFNTLESSPWTRLHIFPYSQRPMTFAAKKYPEPLQGTAASGRRQLVIKERAKTLRTLSATRHAEQAVRQIGQSKQALVLGTRKSPLMGLTRDYWSVVIEGLSLDAIGEVVKGQEIPVVIRGCDREESRTGDLLLYATVAAPAIDTTS